MNAKRTDRPSKLDKTDKGILSVYNPKLRDHQVMNESSIPTKLSIWEKKKIQKAVKFGLMAQGYIKKNGTRKLIKIHQTINIEKHVTLTHNQIYQKFLTDENIAVLQD